MANSHNGEAPGPQSDADFAEAFKELAKGERTAAALENHLDSLEKKIEELLAQAEKAEKDMQSRPANGEPGQSSGKSSS